MLQITVFHKVWNDDILELAGVDGIISTMRLLQYRWLEKLAHMLKTKTPRHVFHGWVLDMSKNSNQLRACPFQTISHWHNVNLRDLGISKDNTKLIQRLTGMI